MILFGECPQCGRTEMCEECLVELSSTRTNIASGEDCFASLPECYLPPTEESKPLLLLAYEGVK